MTGSPGDLEACLFGYLEAAVWSSLHHVPPDGPKGEVCVEFDTVHNFWAEVALEKARLDVAEFLALAGPLVTPWDAGQLGHSFWLSRAHHGAGLWDFKEINGLELDALVQLHFPEITVVLGDDGLTYLE